jgi:uncharacterized membrane protein YadS
VLSLGLMARDRRAGGRRRTGPVPIPWFVLGFVLLVGLNSVVTIPPGLKADIVVATTFLFSVALAAMGLETDIRKLCARGLRPLLLGFAAFLFIAGFSLMLVKIAA